MRYRSLLYFLVIGILAALLIGFNLKDLQFEISYMVFWKLLGIRTFSTMATESYIAGTHSFAFVTVPTEEVAKKIAHGIVKNKLAACVNIIPKVVSIYEWKGEVNEDNEVLMVIKTRSTRLEELTKFVKENHPYEVCEVISSPISQGNIPYLNWISEMVPDKET